MMSNELIGNTHLGFAVLAIGFGSLVIYLKKGEQPHRLLGRAYVLSMLALNGSALSLYELFGGWGLFHWMALLSLATFGSGFIVVKLKASLHWRSQHAYLMSWSFVGLIAALFAEVLVRYSPWPFFGSVAAVSFSVIAIGRWIMYLHLPGILGEKAKA